MTHSFVEQGINAKGIHYAICTCGVIAIGNSEVGLRMAAIEHGVEAHQHTMATDDDGHQWCANCDALIDGDLDAWGRSRENADYGQEPPEGSTRWIYWHAQHNGGEACPKCGWTIGHDPASTDERCV